MRLNPHERASVVREIFEAITAVGFAKWKAEELEQGWGDPGEKGRRAYFAEFRKNHFAEFEQIAAAASDNRLLDMRNEWIEQANAAGLNERQKERDDRGR